MTQEILSAALASFAAGFSVIPLSPGSKLPAVPWKKYQSVRAPPSEIERWFAGRGYNLGLVLGAVSNNTFAMDFDDRDLARFAFDLELVSRETLVQETPRGFHVIFRTEG
ncbi:MAG TPA: bifunctional DNA primase/polymerase [Thermoplasmata archaeon]|nr:bifunctional DNA primase/polymerase [Thermoplasmata archaeon]